MKPQPLQVFCDDNQCTWALSLDMTGAVACALRLSVAPMAQKGARSGKIIAEIRDPRQVDVIVSRVSDESIEPSDLAQELMDLLMTLAEERPSGECVDFLQWRLCEWIVENRRCRFKGENAA
ncbi:MAG TPA: hypothetical protein VHW73_10490 [Rudaea sp.]|jgi:hypothetical protein|nr:hypothetical protein [Rudaea sp.]